jgi:hypothetical protein
MSNLYEVKLNLNNDQLSKLMKSSTVQLSNADIGVGKTFQVAKKVNTKINRAIRNNKGLRITGNELNLQNEIEGGDLLKKMGIKKGVIKYGLPIAKTVAKTVLPMASQAIGDAVGAYTGNPLLGQVAKSAVKDLGNKGIEQIPDGGAMKYKKLLMPVAKTVAKAVLPVASKTIGNAVADYTGNEQLGQLARSTVADLGTEGIKQIPSGSGMRFKKGSAEAKAYMASIRAKRSTSGGSFRPNGKSGGSFRANGKSGGSFRSNGGAMKNDGLLDGHYAVLPNSNMFNGIHSKNGNPILKQMKSTQSLYNEAPRLMAKHGKGLSLIV